MKCNSCGAEIGSNKVCQYCGSQITYSMKREQEQLNKRGCPQCSSSNIEFSRESQGEVRGSNSKQILHRTVGFCKDCGFTWYPSVDNVNIVYNAPVGGSEVNPVVNASGNSNMKWWVLGWIFFFPAPVMILIWRKKNTWDLKVKLTVTIIFWIVLLAIGANADKDGNSSGGRRSSNEQIDEAVLLIEVEDSCGLFERDNEKGGYSVTDYNVYL